MHVTYDDPGALCARPSQGVLVEQVLGHAVLRGPHAAQVGHPVTQLFDGLHLLVQIVRLDEVTHLSRKRRDKSQSIVPNYNHFRDSKHQNEVAKGFTKGPYVVRSCLT